MVQDEMTPDPEEIGYEDSPTAEETPPDAVAHEQTEAEKRRNRLLGITPTSEMKLPAFAGKIDFETLLNEAYLAARGKFFDGGLWASEFLALPDMQLDAIGDWLLVMTCSQDEGSYPENYINIINQIQDLPTEAKSKTGLLKIGYAANYAKRVKLGLKEVREPYMAVPAKAMKLEVRQALETWQTEPESAGVVQVAQIVANAIRRQRLCVMIIDGSPFMASPYGGGKSQLLIQVLYWAYAELGAVFDLRKDIVYRKDRNRMIRMFMDFDRNLPWGIDEFDQFFDRREWAKQENRALVHALEMYRKAGSPIVGACGSIWNADSRVQDKIMTYRLEITDWDDSLFVGRASLFRRFGPPKWQREEEDQWGTKVLDMRFSGLEQDQFKLYMGCNLKTFRWESRGGLDAFLAHHPNWGCDGTSPETEYDDERGTDAEEGSPEN